MELQTNTSDELLCIGSITSITEMKQLLSGLFNRSHHQNSHEGGFVSEVGSHRISSRAQPGNLLE